MSTWGALRPTETLPVAFEVRGLGGFGISSLTRVSRLMHLRAWGFDISRLREVYISRLREV